MFKNRKNYTYRINVLKKKLLGKGSTRDIFKNMGILASGFGVAKIIGLITIPIITRIYSPGDFGILSLFTSVIALLLPLITLRYSFTIPLPNNDGLALNIFILGLFLMSLWCVFLSIIFILFGEGVFGFFNMAEIAAFWWLIIVGLIGATLHELFSYWATRRKIFTPVAKANIWQSSISSLINIALGLLGMKPLGLLIGAVVQKGGGIPLLFKSFIIDFKTNIPSISYKRIKFIARYYRDLPFYRLPSSILLTFSSKIPVFYFAYQFGAEQTGQLGLSLTVVGFPMGLLGKTTANAYYAEIAKYGNKRKSEILEITRSVVKRLSLLGAVPSIVLLVGAPLLFNLIFGAEWVQAGKFTSILAIYLFAQFITSPLVNVFTVFNIQQKFLEINIVRSLLMIIIFGISFIFGFTVYETLILYTFLLSSHYLFVGFQVYNVLK